MFRGSKPVPVESFDMGHGSMNLLMPLISAAMNDMPAIGNRLAYVYFLTTLRGDVLVTLIYNSELGESWMAEAKILHESFTSALAKWRLDGDGSGSNNKTYSTGLTAPTLTDIPTVQIVGRAKKQRLLMPEGGTGMVTEQFQVGERSLLYRQQEESFTQVKKKEKVT